MVLEDVNKALPFSKAERGLFLISISPIYKSLASPAMPRAPVLGALVHRLHTSNWEPEEANKRMLSTRVLTANEPIDFNEGAPGNRSYFVVLFACQRKWNFPHFAHSFASFVEIGDEDSGLKNGTVRQFTISWLPVARKIALLRFPERGRNYSLEETFDWALAMNSEVHAWGPFEIEETLFRKAWQRYDYLESGITQYVVLDNWYRPFMATNCIHALSDLGLTTNLLTTGTAYGVAATLKITRFFRPWMVQPEKPHPFVGDLLGLNRYPIQYQALEPARAPSSFFGWSKWFFPRGAAAQEQSSA